MNNLFSFGSNFGTLGTVFLIAFAVFIVLRLTGLTKGGQSVYQIGRGLQFLAEAPVRLAIRPLLWLVWKIPGAKRAGEWFWSNLTDESLQHFFDRRFAKSKSDLLRGDIEAVARKRFPPEKWPHLWMNKIPDDLVRPLIEDGRLCGSAPATILAPSYVDTVLVGQAFRRAVLAGLFWGFIGLVAWHPQIYLGLPMNGKIAQAGDRSGQAGFDKRRPGSGVDLAYQTAGIQLQEDSWDIEAMNAKIREQSELQGKVLENRREAILASAPGGGITAVLFGVLVFFGTWRGLVRDAAQQRVEPLRQMTKDGIVRYKYRLVERENTYAAYIKQIQKATGYDKDSPIITLGTATGTLLFRGAKNAPMKGQKMCYTLEDCSSGTLVTGGTGGGKTRTLITPVVNQLLDLRRKAIEASNPRQLSFYCTDGKAVLWRDIKAAAEAAGQGDDVRIIGCNEAAGEFGVDLLEGVDPQLVADIIRSVMRQTKGDSGSDSFWPDMAAVILRHTAVVGRAWEMTDDGMELVGVSGERIYSLVMIYQLSLDPELQERAVKAILAALEDPQQWPIMEPFATVELFDSIRYMRSQWTTLADATKTGITANITNAMAPFASNAKLRSAFASGRGKNLMTIDEAWGSICLVNISSLELGVAGRIVNVMLKTLLFTQARKREMADPRIGAREKMAFVADEYQDLITSDVAGLSDTNFAAVCRSTGLFYWIATQSIASLEQAVGQISARAFVQQMRNRVYLRVEDIATIQHAIDNAGETDRSYMFDGEHYESYEAKVRELGYDPIEAGPARIRELPDNYVKALASGWRYAHLASVPISFDTWRAAFELDDRFVPSGWKTSEEAQLSAMQAAAWRQEDRNRQALTEGNHKAPLLLKEDVNGMGQAMAYIYVQRAGAMRQDVVMLD